MVLEGDGEGPEDLPSSPGAVFRGGHGILAGSFIKEAGNSAQDCMDAVAISCPCSTASEVPEATAVAGQGAQF